MIQNHLLIFWRNLYRRPGHSLLNLTCLVTGILSVLLILLYLNFELNYDHFHQQSDHIYRVTTPRVDLTNKQLDINSQNTFLNLGPYLTKDFPEVAAFVRCYGFTSSMRLAWASQNIEEERLQAADQALLDVFSFELLEGSREKALDGPNKIVLSESLARRIFGSGQAAGKLLDAEYVHFITNEEKAHPLMVTAVFKDLPHNSSLTAEAYVSVQTDSELDNYYFNRLGGLTYVLLHDKVDPQAFAPKLSNIYDQYLDPDLEPVMRRAHHELVPLRELHMRASGGYSYIYVFGSIAFLLLLIAAISYVNLATAQASRRSLEVGIRKVVGSSRAQLIWQFLSESLLYILLALALAIFALYKSLPLLNNLLDIQLDAAQLWQPQLSVGILVLVMLLALFGGAYPAFFLSAFRPISAVKGRLASGTVVRKFLLSLQFAVVLFVLICTGLIYQQLQFMRFQDLGFDQGQTIRLALEGDEQLQKFDVFKQVLQQNDLITSVISSNFVPGLGGMYRGPFSAEGEAGPEPQFVRFGQVDYDFLDKMDIGILHGRNFSPDFPADSAQSVIINRQFIDEFGLPDDPIGEKIRRGDANNPSHLLVVGVMENFHNQSLHDPLEAQLLFFSPSGSQVYVKLKEDVSTALAHVETSWKRVYPNADFSFEFLDQMIQEAYQADERRGRIFLSFSLVTLIIAFLGLFGLASYLSRQRIREMGIRRVLGAELSDVVMLLSRDFLLLVCIAAIPAFVAAWWLIGQWLEEFAFRIDMHVGVFVGVFLFTLLLVFLTTAYHAVRSGRINPAESLKHE